MNDKLKGPTKPEGPAWDYFCWFHDHNITKRVSYRGIRTLKYPMDMWNYQEIITERGIDWIVETGSMHGGSALFFADLLSNLGRHLGKVITIDLDPRWHYDAATVANLVPLAKDSGDPDTAAEVYAMIPRDCKGIFLILDSDHSAAHVLRELNAHVPHLRKDDYVVVEDTVINGHPILPGTRPGPWEAIQEYARENPGRLIPDVKRSTKFGSTAAIDGFFIVA
jgi:cephalosporin hydroxylase